MKTVLKWVGIVVLVLIVFVVIFAFVMKGRYSKMAKETFEVNVPAIAVMSDSASLVRGESLAQSACSDCHGGDYAGKTFIDDPTLGKVYTPNITPGGLCANYSDADYVKAIRYGVRPDGTGLLFMPTVAFHEISDSDLGALIGYLKTITPVSKESLAQELAFGAQVMAGAGLFGTLVYAKELDLDNPVSKTAPAFGETPDFGEYTATIHGCVYCHGEKLNGKLSGDPNSPPASNITPGGNFGNWTYEQFADVLWTGKTPEGREMDPEQMPWVGFRLMSDTEKKAIYNYLNSLPALDDSEEVAAWKEKMES